MAEAALGSFRRAAQLAYSQDRRALGCRDDSAGCGDVGGFVPHAQEECRRALRGEKSALGIAVRPRAGSALVFWSEQPDGTPAMDMWHTACNPRRVGGSGRWVLQKFKTPPIQATDREEPKPKSTVEQSRLDATPTAERGEARERMSTSTQHDEL